MKPSAKAAWLSFLLSLALMQGDEIKRRYAHCDIAVSADGSFTLTPPLGHLHSTIDVEVQRLSSVELGISAKALVSPETEWNGESTTQLVFIILFSLCFLPLLRAKRGGKVYSAPGWRLDHLAKTIYSLKTYEEVFEPTLVDLKMEYPRALIEGLWKARWVRIRGYWSFWSAVVAQLPLSIMKIIYEIWKIGK